MLQEQILSKFDAFGESLSDVRDRLGRIETKLDKHGEDIGILKSAVRSNSQDIVALNDAVRHNTEATRANSDAVREMQADLNKYDQRLEIVEAKLAS